MAIIENSTTPNERINEWMMGSKNDERNYSRKKAWTVSCRPLFSAAGNFKKNMKEWVRIKENEREKEYWERIMKSDAEKEEK